jgi:hypothetical protein
MPADYKVLLLGHSGLTYSDSGPPGMHASLLKAELQRQAPAIDWQCAVMPVAPVRNMAAKVAEAVEQEKPDVVFLAPAGTYFTYDYVVVRLRRMAPRLYDRAMRLSRTLKRWAGEGFEGSPSPRGWVFRGPRWLGARLLGTAPLLDVEHAIENTSAALGYLIKRENLVTILKLPTMSSELTGERAAAAGRRLDQYQAAMRAMCRDHHVPCYELREAYGAAGQTLSKGRDGAHWPLEVRKWEASYLAGLILKSLAVEDRAAVTV